MATFEQALAILDHSEILFTADEVDAAISRMAQQIDHVIGGRVPLVLCLMSGAIFVTDKLLSRLHVPLELDYVHATRYGDSQSGGAVQWFRAPRDNVAGRTVLLIDDILDEGHTMLEARQRILEAGAAECLTAVLVVKNHGRPRPLDVDFQGLVVPDRFVFGCGMDIFGLWRNLVDIRALRPDVDPASLAPPDTPL